MSPQGYRLYYQRHLPHYQPAGATFFITFRLAGSLPREVIERLDETVRRKKANLLQQTSQKSIEKDIYLMQRQLFELWDAELDTARHGPRWLAEKPVAELVCRALKYWDGSQYTLDAYCVMPNHVHMVITPISYEDERGVYSLSKIMHSIKSYSANQANKLLHRQGNFWQNESYDHVVRDGEEYRRIVHYVLEIPVCAGLPVRWVCSRVFK